jgi:hypothetical protein
MPVKTTSEKTASPGLKPFVLKWAEKTPEEMLRSHRSVFTPALNGLDISQVLEPETHETTGGNDIADSTNTE